MLSVTSEGIYSNFQAEKSFADFLKIDPSNRTYVNFNEERTSLCLVKRDLGGGTFDLYSPILFQPRFTPEYIKNSFSLFLEALKDEGCVSLYLQTKNEIESGYFIENELVNVDLFRTNYYFNLQDFESILPSQASNSRNLLRKAMRIPHRLLINPIESLDRFSMAYERLANRLNFSSTYKFNHSDFTQLTLGENVYYVELVGESDEFLSGGIFAINGNDVDYLFGVDSNIVIDATRLMLYEVAEFFAQKGFHRLYLGGGVTENDSLAKFKKRMGTVAQKCTAIRAIVNAEQAELLMEDKFSEEWFSGFFPPYLKKQK